MVGLLKCIAVNGNRHLCKISKSSM